MADDVGKHFFAGHAAGVAVCEAEGDALLELAGRDGGAVLLVPSVGLGGGEMQFTQSGRGIGVGGGVAMRFAKQVSAEDAVNDVDVVQRADRTVYGAGMLWSGDGGELVEEFVVGPGFLGEEGG